MKMMLVAFTIALITFSFNNAEAKKRYGHSAAAYANDCLSLDHDPGPLGTQVVRNSCNYPVTFSFCATYADLKIYSCRKKSFGSHQVKANSQTNILRFDGGPTLYACKATHIPRVNKSTMKYTCMGYDDDASADKVRPVNKVRPSNKEVTDSAVEPSNENYCEDVFRELTHKSNANSTEGLQNAIRRGAPSSCSDYVEDFASRVWYKPPNAETISATEKDPEPEQVSSGSSCKGRWEEYLKIAMTYRPSQQRAIGFNFFDTAREVYESCPDDTETRQKIVNHICRFGMYACEASVRRMKNGPSGFEQYED